MQTPTLFGAAQPQGMAAMTPGGGCASPHQISMVEMVAAIQRAKQAENMLVLEKNVSASKDVQIKAHQSVGSFFNKSCPI